MERLENGRGACFCVELELRLCTALHWFVVKSPKNFRISKHLCSVMLFANKVIRCPSGSYVSTNIEDTWYGNTKQASTRIEKVH